MKLSISFFIFIVILCFNILNAQEEQSNENKATGVVSTLLESILHNDISGIDRALELGEDINLTNENGWTSAMFAVALNNHAILQKLIESGIDLNIPDVDGFTPLMRASAESNLEMVEILLAGNASPLIATPKGDTAFKLAGRKRISSLLAEACLLHAMEGDNMQELVLSLENGAYVNIHNRAGWTALMYVVTKGDIELVKTMLTKYGADANRQENDGWTALHFAVTGNLEEITKALLSAGADSGIPTADGLTAREIAVQNENQALIDLLPNLKNAEL